MKQFILKIFRLYASRFLSNFCYLICVRHLIRSRAVTYSEKPPSCVRNMIRASDISTISSIKFQISIQI